MPLFCHASFFFPLLQNRAKFMLDGARSRGIYEKIVGKITAQGWGTNRKNSLRFQRCSTTNSCFEFRGEIRGISCRISISSYIQDGLEFVVEPSRGDCKNKRKFWYNMLDFFWVSVLESIDFKVCFIFVNDLVVCSSTVLR